MHKTMQMNMRNAHAIQLREMNLIAMPTPVECDRCSPAAIPQLIEAALADGDQANMFMRMFHLLNALGMNEFALEMQAKALERRVFYRLAGPAQPAIRLLALTGPGNWTENAPLEFLLEGSDIRLDLWFFVPGAALPESVPDHDVAMVALGESANNLPLLEQMGAVLDNWPRPVLNRPLQIANCARDTACQLLRGIPGLRVPETRRMERGEMPELRFPVTIRPAGLHGGKGLAKLGGADDLGAYLQSNPARQFYVAEYVDYRGGDGLYRKVRIALIDGAPYVCHLAIADHWIVHYVPAGMQHSPDKRAEEEHMMRNFDRGFAVRHRAALAAIGHRLQLEYVVLDCAETGDGSLLFFEADNRGWIHALDPVELFPYKAPVMRKAFSAFGRMLSKRMAASVNAH